MEIICFAPAKSIAQQESKKKKRSSSYRNPFTNISINRRLLTTLQYYFISQKYKLKRNQQKLIWKRKPGEQGIQIFVIFPFPIIKSLSILTKTISTAHQLSSDSQRYSTGLKTHRVGWPKCLTLAACRKEKLIFMWIILASHQISCGPIECGHIVIGWTGPGTKTELLCKRIIRSL